jgi:hypothetical protein
LWKYGFVKFLFSILVGGLIINSGSKASSILNNVFEVDSSVFIYSHSVLTGLLFFKILKPLFWLVVVSCIVHMIVIWSDVKEENYRIKPFMLLICSLFVGFYSLNTISNTLTEEDLNLKAYKLAHYLDFNNKIYCLNEGDKELNGKNKSEVVGVFLGANHSRYLLDNKLDINEDARRFIHSKATKENEWPRDAEKEKNLIFGKCI